MEKTKIQLSEEELQLMQNSQWILTKNEVIDKICLGFGELLIRMQQQVDVSNLPTCKEIFSVSPKISKGEKYKGLPYIILDYPRIFGKEDVLAIRSLFWWGNFCSITLHVKGKYHEQVLRKLAGNIEFFGNDPFYLSFSGNEWDHDLMTDSYTALHKFSRQDLEKKLPKAIFLKLAAKVEIEPWDIMERKLYDLFLQLSELLKD